MYSCLNLVPGRGFEPPPATLRVAMRAQSDSIFSQAPLEICSPKTGLELLLSDACFDFGTTCVVIFQCDRQSMRGRWNTSRAMCAVLFRKSLAEPTYTSASAHLSTQV